MSFLSRLFKKKKEEPPAPPKPVQREPAKPPAPPPPPPPPPVQREPAKAAPLPPPPVQREPVKPAPPPPPPPPPPQPQPPRPQVPPVPPAPPVPDAFSTMKAEPVRPREEPKPFISAATTPLGSTGLTLEPPKPPPPPPTPESRTGTAPLEGSQMAPAQSNAMVAGTVPLGGGLDLFEDDDSFLDDFDAHFDAAIGGAGSESLADAGGASPHGVIVDQTPVRELFADIAANYVRAVRNFMIEINRGDTAKEWIDICQPAVHSIKRAAEKMDLTDVHAAIEDFDAILELASSSPGRLITTDIREELISTYSTLVELMPQAFTLEAERDQRESIIIHSLLMQVPDVRKVTVDKLYAAGLTTLEVFFLAKPEDLAATAGIPDWLATKIVDKFQNYRAEMTTQSVDPNRTAERAKLSTLIADLKSQQEGYERASNGWTEDAAEEKKRLRQARQDTLLQINVVLAQLGEVDLIHEIEKLPFERRIDRLQQYLQEGPAGEVPL